MESNVFIPSVGSGLAQPLADLWALIEVKHESQTQGHKITFCLLCFVSLEAWVAKCVGKGAQFYVEKSLEALGACSEMQEEVRELRVQRNTIGHGHAHVENQSWSSEEDGPPHVERGERVTGKEDESFKAVVKPGTQWTKLLGLHLNPAEIDRSDCRAAARVFLKVLDFLAEKAGKVQPDPDRSGFGVWFPHLGAVGGQAENISMGAFLKRVEDSQGL